MLADLVSMMPSVHVTRPIRQHTDAIVLQDSTDSTANVSPAAYIIDSPWQLAQYIIIIIIRFISCKLATEDILHSNTHHGAFIIKRAGAALNDLLSFYCSMNRPVLEYAICSPVWHSNLTVAQTKALESDEHYVFRRY